jgi:hypothetical protein
MFIYKSFGLAMILASKSGENLTNSGSCENSVQQAFIIVKKALTDDQWKTVYDVTPVFLKSVTRIEGLLFVYFIAMLVQALIEREIRKEMKSENIESIPIYPEDRGCESPTTDMVLSHFNNIQVNRLWSDKKLVQTFLTPMSEKQRALLSFAGVPIETYNQLG